jgi:hypothetical protein
VVVAAAQPQELPHELPQELQPQPLPLLLFARRRRQNASDVSAVATNVTTAASAVRAIRHEILLVITHLL